MPVVVSDAEVTLADVLSLRLTVDEPLADGTELVLRNRATAVESRVPLGAPGVQIREAALAVSLAPLALGPAAGTPTCNRVRRARGCAASTPGSPSTTWTRTR